MLYDFADDADDYPAAAAEPAPSSKRSRSIKPKVSVGSQPGVASRRRRPGGRVDPAAVDLPRSAGRAGDRPQGGRGPRPHAAGIVGLARCRDHARRHDRRPDGHPLRTRTRHGREGRQGDEPPEGHRLRDGGHRRPHPCPDPRPLRDRRRGAEPATPAGGAGRSARLTGSGQGHQPARGRRRQGHRRQSGVPRSCGHTAPAHRGRDRRRQVERHQLHHHVAADAHHTR